MPRAGLDTAVVVAAAADLADEIGLANLTLARVAEHFGVKTPSLYKHIDGQADLNRRISLLALTELGDALRDALQGRAGKDALSASAHTLRDFVIAHPGRYAASVRLDPSEPDDPLAVAGVRVMDSLSVVLAAYDVDPADRVHALRLLRSLLHGFAVLEAAGGFQMDVDVDDSFEWLVEFLDRGLRR